jgi:SPP1 family predicted phage head-tail adaptor
MNWLTQDVLYQTRTIAVSTDSGENVETWSAGNMIKGRVRPLSMKEQYYRNKEHTEITHRLYSTTVVNERGRVVHNSKNYDIISVINPMEFNRFYQIDLKVVE